ncbi:hypothetical protein MAPG_02032 [Magnaporthiopsis poae ATCC 64411]|uniref:Uncharacterized protein n=1 Tax=Magnaporthiopsis poae (strain ATCC 64411 / 73-15) TaxID=644358 RepID=A0A0C4DQ94_MAGP6|nr:hypothetical protein MAPG_02032 [Magnaporthiopsis poae ATCC 64411]
MRILKIATAAWQLLGATTGVLAQDRYPPDPTQGWLQRHTVTDRPRPVSGHDFDHRGMKKLRQMGDYGRGGHDFNRSYLTDRPCIWEDSHYWTSCDHFRIDFPIDKKDLNAQDAVLWGKDFAEVRVALPCKWSTPDIWQEIAVPGLPHRVYIQPGGNACTNPRGVIKAAKHDYIWIEYGNLTIQVSKRCRFHKEWALTRCLIPVRP